MSRFQTLPVLDISMELKEFKTTVLPLRSKLLNYARKMTQEEENAEDVVQEVLLKLWSKREELEQYRSIEAFAMTLVHNLCIDLWRSKYSETTPLHDNQMPASVCGPDRILEAKDEWQLMDSIINALPPLQGAIMRMKDIEGYETDEIAAITGCKSEAIRSNLSRARKKVRELYLKAIQERTRRK